MNWVDEVDRRSRAFANLCQALQFAVKAGDRLSVRLLRSQVDRFRSRLKYAEKMRRMGERVFTPENARFATPDNRPDNGPAARGN